MEILAQIVTYGGFCPILSMEGVWPAGRLHVRPPPAAVDLLRRRIPSRTACCRQDSAAISTNWHSSARARSLVLACRVIRGGGGGMARCRQVLLCEAWRQPHARGLLASLSQSQICGRGRRSVGAKWYCHGPTKPATDQAGRGRRPMQFLIIARRISSVCSVFSSSHRMLDWSRYWRVATPQRPLVGLRRYQ